MTDRQNTFHSPQRTRKKHDAPKILLLAAVGVSVLLIILMLWASGQKNPGTQPPQTTNSTTEPTTEVTEPQETQPQETTAADVIAAFAAQNGLTMDDYPEKLIQLLERNPETEEYVLNYPLEYGKDHKIDISGYANYEGVPLFIQWDKQWGYLDYAGNQAGLSACGPTCLSMVLYHFTRDASMTPAYVMEFAEANGHGLKDSGTQWSLFGEGAGDLGLTVKELTSEQMQSAEKIAQVLDSGKLIVANVGPGVFTEFGHYIVFTGCEDGKFRVNDPNSYIRSEKLWEFEEFADQLKMMWSFSYE